MAKISGLGRGLSALMDDEAKSAIPQTAAHPFDSDPFAEQEIDVNLLVPNPFQQRTEFDQKKLIELSVSMYKRSSSASGADAVHLANNVTAANVV